MRKFHQKLSGRFILWACLLLSLLAVWFFRHLIYTSYTLAVLPLIWRNHASDFIISPKRDNFDLTLSNYSANKLSAEPYSDVVPPVLHHFAFGREGSHQRSKWEEAVQSCLKWHPGWESHLWTDDKASEFVAKRFPELKDMWDNYPYLIERIDALRYMVLYEYGGVILDMDLKCKRSLGPLRRFDFVAPAAHPTGFSIGFMMASRHNKFVGDIVRSLKMYNKKWLGLPYSSVMFSTGCHFASTIHAFQSNRTDLKILPGPLHSLNGHVSTPLFDHLGSSSWHSYDAALIVRLGRSGRAIKLVCLSLFLALAIVVGRRVSSLRRLVARLARQANGLWIGSTKSTPTL